MQRSKVLKDIPSAEYYFVGIGGYGMSGLARILAEAGFRVRGSDARESPRVDRLRQLGIDIAIGHRADRIRDDQILVYSTDVPDDNPELVEARRLGIQIWHRSHLLARLINSGRGVAITGTHGKTTATTMVGMLLMDAGLDPTVSVGGEVDRWGGTGRLGSTDWIVAEACESDGTFVHYHPEIAIVNNLEPEHLDHYEGSYELLKKAFARFVGGLPADGTLVICADDDGAMGLKNFAPGHVLTFGLNGSAQIRAVALEMQPAGWEFTVIAHGDTVARFRLGVPGRHNVMNALAAIAVGTQLQIPPDVMVRSLAAYRGVDRRFQIVAQPNGVLIVDDYAHHPTEIRATLQAARERSRGRVLAVFQPQRYSRTQRLMTEFSRAFAAADQIILLPIYAPPGEEPIPGVSGEALARLAEQESPGKVVFLPHKEAAVDWLEHAVRTDDLVITMGAGDIGEVAYKLSTRLSLPSHRHA